MQAQPHVVIFGSSITSAYFSGSTSLFRALVSAFIRRGWHVIFLEQTASWFDTCADYRFVDKDLTILRYAASADLIALEQQHQFLDRAQLVIKFSGCSLTYDRFIDEWLVASKRRQARPFRVVYVDADAPMRMPFIAGHPKFYLYAIIHEFDLVWVMLGGHRAAREYAAMGARRTWVSPVAIDTQAFAQSPPKNEYCADLLFMGNPAHDREQGLQRLFFDVADVCQHHHFLLVGAQWGEVVLPRNVSYLGYLPSDELPALYSSARLVLNVTREAMATYGYAGALRLFEAAACSACILSDRWIGIDELFVPGEEILLVDSTRDVIDLVQSPDVARYRLVGRRACTRVMRDHTADARLGQFLLVLEGG